MIGLLLAPMVGGIAWMIYCILRQMTSHGDESMRWYARAGAGYIVVMFGYVVILVGAAFR